MKSALSLTRRFSLLLLFAANATGQVIISEFMADNKNTLADVDGKFSDWIELYNTSSTNVNLAGWSLTQDPTHAARWLFPGTNLTAKGFLVVFATGTNRAVVGAELHVDFKLKASGDYLALLRPNGSVATEFSPAYPQQYADISYGTEQVITTNVLVAQGATARVLIPPNSTLGSTWTQPGFSDASWISGPSGVGYQTAVPGFAVSNFVANVTVGSLAAAQGVIANPAQQLAVYAENAAIVN